MGFPTFKPPISLTSSSQSSSSSSSPPSSSSSQTQQPSSTGSETSRQRPRNSERHPAHRGRSETYLSPHATISNGVRAVRERRRRRQLSRRRAPNTEPQLLPDLTTASFLASSFQINTTPSMSTIPLAKPLFGTYPILFVQSHASTSRDDGAMEIHDQSSESDEVDDIPSDLFGVEFIYHNRNLAMEVLLGNLAGDESFADLLGLPADTFSDSSSEEDVYEDDMSLDLDMEEATEDASEDSSPDQSIGGDILRGVDEDYD